MVRRRTIGTLARFGVVASCVPALLSGGPATVHAQGAQAATPEGKSGVAIVVMRPTAGHEASGTVLIRDNGKGGVTLQISLENLPAGTDHGFHVHEFGDCSAPDASSAGPHYDPTHNMLGQHQHGMKPLGDLEDLSAGPDGKVSRTFDAPSLSVSGENPIAGRGLLLHESAADPSDPMSSAGARIACGVIGLRNPDEGAPAR